MKRVADEKKGAKDSSTRLLKKGASAGRENSLAPGL